MFAKVGSKVKIVLIVLICCSAVAFFVGLIVIRNNRNKSFLGDASIMINKAKSMYYNSIYRNDESVFYIGVESDKICLSSVEGIETLKSPYSNEEYIFDNCESYIEFNRGLSGDENPPHLEERIAFIYLVSCNKKKNDCHYLKQARSLPISEFLLSSENISRK